MGRSAKPVPPGTTGFVATFVLACTFLGLAVVVWMSHESGATAIDRQRGAALTLPSAAGTAVGQEAGNGSYTQ